ncbi:LTA synthase family protein [Flavobacterium sp.]|uniref:LTA synthase family protein n=1 Tax=Flavobacterium sp. TaxID=239 RepID=UPI003527A247
MKFSNRFLLFFTYSLGFLLLSFLLRIVLLIWQFSDIDSGVFTFVRILITGLFFDIGVVSFLAVFFSGYILIIPQKAIGTLVDKTIIYFGFFLITLVLIFTFFAEITFWDEFHCRFNFVAVDYLIYTYEVVQNINQSYPLIILIPSIIGFVLLIFWWFTKQKIFFKTFKAKISFKQKLIAFSVSLLLCCFYIFFIKNSQAEWSNNRYSNEISKAGIYSFFSEFRNNRLDYATFYPTISNQNAFKKVKSNFESQHFISNEATTIKRIINDSNAEIKPNVVFILMESMSASFMQSFGNTENITPFLDSIAHKGMLFRKLFATGNRTVRGMEAVTLSFPPTPGQSIVKRPNNANLFTISNVFKQKGYTCNFFYGGDGYFDNMNAFYGGNGFAIFDRGRGSILNDAIHTTRTNIENNEVTFENAWGICDEDIYNKMIKEADNEFAKKQPFLNFIMTTSNHRPYTYPEPSIDIPSGTNRKGAVKYSDYALAQLFKKIKTKPWFSNTIFVFIADHCASSAGKDEIDVQNYHIPAIIYSEKYIEPQTVEKLCSQIDIFPTLFSTMNWSYTSNFFGSNVLSAKYKPRALIATYLKLGLLKPNNTVCILSNNKSVKQYKWNETNNELTPIELNKSFKEETISWYQTGDFLFNQNKLN